MISKFLQQNRVYFKLFYQSCIISLKTIPITPAHSHNNSKTEKAKVKRPLFFSSTSTLVIPNAYITIKVLSRIIHLCTLCHYALTCWHTLVEVQIPEASGSLLARDLISVNDMVMGEWARRHVLLASYNRRLDG